MQKIQTCSYNAQANGVCKRMHKSLIKMILYFVNKDAKNWDRCVLYALTACRATPHCTVKYSPYYLVYDRELLLHIKDDWKPKRRERVETEIDYDRHIRELVKRLHEAQVEARRQPKLSNENA
jgi:hypothetical protein